MCQSTNSNPSLPLVRELVARGDVTVAFLADLTHLPERLDQLSWLLTRTTAEILARDLDAVRAERPDYVITDSVAPWGHWLAQALDVPVVTSITTFAFSRHVLAFAARHGARPKSARLALLLRGVPRSRRAGADATGRHHSAYDVGMALDTILGWLGLGPAVADVPDQAPLRDLIDTLEHLDPTRARHLARFAYLLGRVARADLQVSVEETAAMEALVVTEGGLTADQAVVVVGLAKASNLMFGSTADFLVAQEFADAASYDEKLALARCLFRLAATDASISVAEESELHRITGQLKILPHDVTTLRVAYANYLPGLSSRPR